MPKSTTKKSGAVTGRRQPTLHKSLEKLAEVKRQLTQEFCEREQEVDGIIAALVARQHVLLLGPPGTAKSALARAACGAIEGGAYFKWLLTKFTTPEEIFGPISLKALEQDEYRRVTTGKMPEATVAFLDECFKANSAILNSVLTILEEREFDNGAGGALPCPLVSCVGASNELPKDDSLGALYDRFLLRYWVAPLSEPGSMRRVYTGTGQPTITASIKSDELAKVQAAVDGVSVPDDVAERLLEVKRALENIGVVGSDRRWKSCMALVKANALLRGAFAVTGSDLLILGNCMWREPDQRQQVASVVGEIASPAVAEALQISDAATQAHRDLCAAVDTPEFFEKVVDVRADLKRMRIQLNELLKSNPACPEAETALALVRKLQADAKRRHDSALD